MSTKVRTLIESVASTLQDASPLYARWTEADYIRYFGFGELALAKYLPHLSTRTDTVKLRAGTRQDFATVLAADIKPGTGAAADVRGIALRRLVRNMGADGLTPGKAIAGPVDRYTKDVLEPDWHTETAAVVREFVFDREAPLQAYVSPGVTGTVWAEIQWMVMPPALPAAGAPNAEVYVAGQAQADTLLWCPDTFVEDLHNYAVAVALLKGSKNTLNLPKAQQHANWFVQSINAQAQAITGVSPNLAALPFLAEARGG